MEPYNTCVSTVFIMNHKTIYLRLYSWSFGILLWELATLGCEPYPDTPTNMVLQLLKSGYRMKKPENCSDVL